MILNHSEQNQGVIIWDGVPRPVDTRRHTSVSFDFHVTADLVADAVFIVQEAPADEADVCAPGIFAPVENVPLCDTDPHVVPTVNVTIAVPGGTKKGTVCYGALPCKPGPFVQLSAASGPTTNVRAIAVLSGPR